MDTHICHRDAAHLVVRCGSELGHEALTASVGLLDFSLLFFSITATTVGTATEPDSTNKTLIVSINSE